MLSQLSRDERLRLMKFVCTIAWADLKVQEAERTFVSDLARKLELAPDEVAQVEEWLSVPPPSDEVDPTEIPESHRRIFLEVLGQLTRADGRVYQRERESIALLRDLLTA